MSAARAALLLSIVCGLVGACAGGAWLTWRVAAAGGLMAVPDSRAFLAAVDAVSHLVVVGWFGAALLASGEVVLAPRWGRSPLAPGALRLVVVELTAGLALRTGGALADLPWAIVLGAALEIAAIAWFASGCARAAQATADSSRGPMLAAVGSLLAACVLDGMHGLNLATAADPAALIDAVATWQPVLRHLQLHAAGVLGVIALERALSISPARRWVAPAVLAAVASEIALHIAYRHTRNHALAAGLLVPWLLLAAVALAQAPWRGPLLRRAAWIWLLIALTMFLLFRPYHRLLGMHFSHAYLAAAGLAAAIGFLGQGVLAALDRALGARVSLPAALTLQAGLAMLVVGMAGLDWVPRLGPGSAAWLGGILVAGGSVCALGLAWLLLALLRPPAR